MLEENEEPLRGAQREAAEETGEPGDHKARKIDERVRNGLRFHTFHQPIERQFEPILNEEHTDYGWFQPNELPDPLHPGLKATLRSMDVIDAEGPGHPFRGNQYVEGQSEGKPPQKGDLPRVYDNKNQPKLKNQPTKDETDKIGEGVVLDWLKSEGMMDARSLNVVGNNYPIDAAGDHWLMEIKSGRVDNVPSARQWRITWSVSKAEREAQTKMSPAQIKAWNTGKQTEAYNRKLQEKRKIEREKGEKFKAKTIGVIINADTKRADIHVLDGYHKRIGWRNPEDIAGSYVKTVKFK
jgi:hypothetical protein